MAVSTHPSLRVTRESDTNGCGLAAPLSQSAGDLISKNTRVIANLGSTETACLQRLAPGIDDWPYFYWHPTHSGIEMRRLEEDEEFYELFLVRDHPRLELYQGIFNTFPDITEWSMGDLYSRHPDPAKSFLYRYRGRKDDVVVLSNGEKIAPSLIEATLMSSKLVRGAMLVGRGKFQLAALLDLVDGPPTTALERYHLLQKLGPVIAEANRLAPAHGQLDEYHILFAHPDRPLSYLGQGKIQRRKTYSLYEDDIEAFYSAIDRVQNQATIARATDSAFEKPQVQFSDIKSIQAWLRRLIMQVTSIDVAGADLSFFEFGMDSLQVLRMTTEMRVQLGMMGGYPQQRLDKLSPKVIYANHSLRQLSSFFLQPYGDAVKERSLATDSGYQSEGSTDSSQDIAPVTQMQAILDKYTAGLPQPRHYHLEENQYHAPPAESQTENMTVLLTGSTGSLGSYILEKLSRNRRVSKIVCLNRSADAAKRHASMTQSRGLNALDPSRVIFYKADLSKRQLGLADGAYQELLQTVTHIIREY